MEEKQVAADDGCCQVLACTQQVTEGITESHFTKTYIGSIINIVFHSVWTVEVVVTGGTIVLVGIKFYSVHCNTAGITGFT